MVEHEPYSGLLFLGFERLSRQNNAFYNDPVGVDGQNTAGGDEREGTAGHEAEDEDRGGGEKNGTVARSHRSDSFLEETLVFEFVPLKRVFAKNGTKGNPPDDNDHVVVVVVVIHLLSPIPQLQLDRRVPQRLWPRPHHPITSISCCAHPSAAAFC